MVWQSLILAFLLNFAQRTVLAWSKKTGIESLTAYMVAEIFAMKYNTQNVSI